MSNATPWQSGNTLLECIKLMLQSGVAADVTFLVKGSQIRAHKFILISRSPTFEAMFTGSMSKQEDPMSEQKPIEITDVSKDIFNVFLRYMYTDNIDINIDNVVDILKVADKYLVDILIQKCHVFIEEHLNPDNVCRMRERYHSFPNDTLLAECLRVEEESACAVLKSTGFTELCQKCVDELIFSDSLPVDEHFVFEAVIRWAEAECRRQGMAVTDANRRKCSGDLIYRVRFPVMNDDYFCKSVFKMSVLSNDELVEIHRYIHAEEQLNQLTEVHAEQTHTHTTSLGGCNTIPSPSEQSNQRCDGMVEANQRQVNQGQVCGFDCKYRVGYRKGDFKRVSRQLSSSSIINSKITAISEHFQSSSRVYLHGLTTQLNAGQIKVQVNDQFVRVDFAVDNPGVVLFRKIIRIDPDTDNVVYVEVVSETTMVKKKFTNRLTFGDVTINFTDSESRQNGFVSGFLLSK